MNIKSTFARIATAGVLAASLAGCASMSPYQGSQVGSATGGLVGGLLGHGLGGGTAGTIAGAVAGVVIGGSIGQSAAEQNGRCVIRRDVEIIDGYPREYVHQTCSKVGPYTPNQPRPGQY
jgi:outer membrane lipoprotein SlyB